MWPSSLTQQWHHNLSLYIVWTIQCSSRLTVPHSRAHTHNTSAHTWVTEEMAKHVILILFNMSRGWTGKTSEFLKKTRTVSVLNTHVKGEWVIVETQGKVPSLAEGPYSVERMCCMRPFFFPFPLPFEKSVHVTGYCFIETEEPVEMVQSTSRLPQNDSSIRTHGVIGSWAYCSSTV